jgi:ribonuclease G
VKQLIVSADTWEVRVAVLEQNRLAELYLERRQQPSLVGNIYRARVENVLGGMDAAFVDIGLPKNGFLYVDEVVVPEESDARPRKITQLLRPGQEITVQVTKDPMGTKGPRLTTQLSIAGRYLVYVPGGTMCGVSRRLPDAERMRLRRLCHDLRPERAGLIMRTAAEGASERAVSRDLRYLETVWSSVQRRLEGVGAPAQVYTESDLAVRIVRDVFTEEFAGILVDDQGVQGRIVSFLQSTAPELVDRVEPYQGSRPLFETYGLDEEIKKALNRRVELPSGGYLVIDETEAMTVIDVNTGRYVGRTYLEDTILKTNLEACREVVRQLRIRDLGGIVVIDFIDMARRENREAVLGALEAELSGDRTKTYVVELSPLGLVEMTRKTETDGLRDILTEECPHCRGEGVRLSDESVAVVTERRLQRVAATSSADAFLVEVHPRVVGIMTARGGTRLRDLEATTGRYFSLEGVEYVGLTEVAVAGEGPREVIMRASLPVAVGQQVDLRIEEVHAYDHRSGVARLEGFPVCVSNAAGAVGRTVRVTIDDVRRTCAYGHLAENSKC